MDQNEFLKTWYCESLRIAPLQEGESHSYMDFVSSPIVRAALFAFRMNSPLFALDLTILEENLLSCLELKSLSQVARTIVEGALRQVQQMKKVTT